MCLQDQMAVTFQSSLTEGKGLVSISSLWSGRRGEEQPSHCPGTESSLFSFSLSLSFFFSCFDMGDATQDLHTLLHS